MGDAAEALGLRREPTYDYGPEPPRRWSQPWSATAVRVATAAGALIVGFLLSSGLVAGRDAARAQDDRREQLIELIGQRHEHTAALSTQLDELRTVVDEVEGGLARRAPALNEELGAVEAAVGLTALTGPGARITLSDAAGTCPTGHEEDCRIHDTDLQLAANTLFAMGAEAIAVNGERLIATSAIRSAGRAVLVNYRVLVSPYVVEAVGDADALAEGFRASALGQEFSTWSEVYGLGIAVEAVDDLTLPAYSGSVRLRAAAPGGAS
jgi:uncharacterized protein YlxW (UPF0749 family)